MTSPAAAASPAAQQPADAAAAAVAALALASAGAGGGGGSSSTGGGSVRLASFSERAPDAVVNGQIVDLGQQLFVWLGVGGAKLGSLHLAVQSRADAAPSVATLLPDGAIGSGASLAQRLALRVGRPVLCSCNLPRDAEMLQVIAERRLLWELEALGLLSGGAGGGGAAAAAADQHGGGGPAAAVG